jgi:anti-sigma regulatory factor (Ser/Thr protein kinase)
MGTTVERETQEVLMSGLQWAAVSLPCQPATPAAARHFVRGVISDDPLFEKLELLVSEVVTNAVLHAQSAVEISVGAANGRIRVEVADTSPVTPERRPSGATGGYGLYLLDTMAAAWGVEQHGHGKTVWFEIADPSSAAT